MAIDKRLVIRNLLETKEIYTAFARATNLPYVVCDPETFNDQIYVFTKEEDVKSYVKQQAEQGIGLMGVRTFKQQYLNFFSTLVSLGVNAIVLCDEGEMELDLNEIVKQPDYSQIPKEQRPLMNPQLQLTAIYFLQELRRPGKIEEKNNIRELDEELSANLARAEFLCPVEFEPLEERQDESKRKFRFMLLKNKEGATYQPLCTDALEFKKFGKGNANIRPLKIPFAKLEKTLMKEAKGYVLNPQGFNLPLMREQLPLIRRRFGIEEA